LIDKASILNHFFTNFDQLMEASDEEGSFRSARNGIVAAAVDAVAVAAVAVVVVFVVLLSPKRQNKTISLKTT
jgi:hypothetical protein